jgi:hypothetical protein
LTWWHKPVTPALGRQRQEDLEFEASLGCIGVPTSKKKKKEQQRKNTKTKSQWLTHIILTTQEAEIRRITV